MNQLTEKSIGCPYCGESIKVLIEPSDIEQQYIEDCQVCCQPINFQISESVNGDLLVRVYSDDESF
ncbi:MAG: CPXCG motif-containing cysteine-rich protein [Alteromonadaceae bacterium]